MVKPSPFAPSPSLSSASSSSDGSSTRCAAEGLASAASGTGRYAALPRFIGRTAGCSGRRGRGATDMWRLGAAAPSGSCTRVLAGARIGGADEDGDGDALQLEALCNVVGPPDRPRARRKAHYAPPQLDGRTGGSIRVLACRGSDSDRSEELGKRTKLDASRRGDFDKKEPWKLGVLASLAGSFLSLLRCRTAQGRCELFFVGYGGRYGATVSQP